MNKRRLLRAVACTALAAFSFASHAAWPEGPIKIIVPFGAGGNTDILARMVAQQLGEELRQPVIVENKPGAGSMLGSQVAARSPADGYTLLLGGIATVLNDVTYKKPLIDMRKELVPVSLLATVPNYLAVNPKLPVSSTKELVDMLKASPGKYSCANSGVGTSTYLSCILFRDLAKVDMVLVPYKSGVQALTDVIGGSATMVMVNESLPYIRQGQLKGLAVTSAEPSPLTPNLPPVAKTLPGYDVTSWYAIFAPAGTPDAIVQKVDQMARKVMHSRSAKEKLDSLGAVAGTMDQKQFAVFVDKELDRWGKIIRPLNLQLD
ncbi:ABC transporter substrate-binding protein [Bordetella sputigena]|uniref:Bug family tripartite tricarboxylate transporter substrate binding protein n=1 Tax=Bordetella sputigena TaxID=1416810 RepID=UPI0039EEDF5E